MVFKLQLWINTARSLKQMLNLIVLVTSHHIQVNLDMTDHCMTDFCIWRTICLVPVWSISSIRHMYTTDFAYDGPIFLVPLSLSYPSSPVFECLIRKTNEKSSIKIMLVIQKECTRLRVRHFSLFHRLLLPYLRDHHSALCRSRLTKVYWACPDGRVV